jgi:SAM-dependent methyltransferase
MDIELLESLEHVRWAGEAADLGCGTGRTGTWLREQGVEAIDGVDLTPEMLDVARERGVHRRLVEADVTATGLDDEAYDLVVTSLVDEHLADLRPLYAEAHRLAKPGASYVLVGYHPHFIMATGMPTHYDSASGESVAIETHVHLLSEHTDAALGAGWQLAELKERVIDDVWLELKPKWEHLRHQPVTFAFVWRR